MRGPPSCLVRTILEVSGMLRPRASRSPLLYEVYAYFAFLSIAYCLGGSIAYIVLEKGTAIQKLQSVLISITILNGFIKHLNTIMSQDSIQKLLYDFDKLWDQLYEEPANRKYLEPAAKRGYRIYRLLVLIYYIIPILNGIPPLVIYFIAGVNELNYQILMPTNNFVVGHLLQALLTLFSFLTNSSQTFLYHSLSNQLAACMEVLQRKLREENISNQTAILHHEIMKLSKHMNEHYGWLLYFETNTVAIECSCAAYVFCKETLINGNKNALIADGTNLLFCYFVPFVICSSGEEIKKQSEQIFREAYNGVWYEQPLTARKTLKIIMLGASKPQTLHYKNLVVFGMQLFLAIINGTYTLLNAILWLDK